MQGWAGWCGELYQIKNPEVSIADIDVALQAKAKETGHGVAVLAEHNSLYGWGYTDKRYLEGGYWWPFFIESDAFLNANTVHIEQRKEVRDLNA